MVDYTPLDTFPLDHPAREAAEKAFGGVPFLNVRWAPGEARRARTTLGCCYWNVAEAVQKHGGKSVLGWQILLWPGVYVEALHHAVWQKPDGELVDITDALPGEARLSTTFVPDDSIKIDLSRLGGVQNRYHKLSDSPLVDRLIAVGNEQTENMKSIIDMHIAFGGKYDPYKDLEIPPARRMFFKKDAERRQVLLGQFGSIATACGKLPGASPYPRRL